MKQQLLENREVLIKNLELKINELKNERNELLNGQKNNSVSTEHVNIQQYLNDQKFPNQKVHKSQIIPAPKTQNDVYEGTEVKMSKADLFREQKETKEKLEQLKDLYEKKRQLQSIGIYENNLNKISSMYNNREMKRKIDRKIVQSKKKVQIKQEKDKIIKEELQKVQKFLKEGKGKNKNNRVQPQNHYSKLITNQKDLKIYEQLLGKTTLNITQKQKLLDFTYEFLKDQTATVKKQKLKLFLLSNPEFCIIFFISKVEIMRDLEVHPTKKINQFSYQQYYQMIKSIQITNKALNPNMNFKVKQGVQNKKQKKKDKKSNEVQYQREMEKYLKHLYVYFDTKSENIIERQRFELALKKGLLYDERKYKLIKKVEINEFGEQLMRKREKLPKLDYYKSLDMKYIGLEEIIEEYKKYRTKQQKGNESKKEQQVHEEQREQEVNEAPVEQSEQQQYVPEILPNPALEEDDFKEYGWQKDQDQVEQKFRDLKQLDNYYNEIRNKYGNQISWNGIQRYRQDFTKFNECIKQLNSQHIDQKKI